MNKWIAGWTVGRKARGGVPRLALLSFLSLLPSAGCGAFNPAFLNLIDPNPAGTFVTLDNAPGHVIIAFVNNAEVDERLVAFLESTDGGSLTLSDTEKRALRPRVRLQVEVTFLDGSQTTIEFVDGSANLVSQNFDTSAMPDLNQNDLDNAIVLCNVAAVQVLRQSIEVFIPVALQAYELIEVTTPGGGTLPEFQPRERDVPRFRVLQVDQVDDDMNTLVQANIGIRDVPAPVTNLLCGSVVAVTMNGVLRVPFLDGVDNSPSFDRQDQQTVASIGGRYEFVVSVQ